jgi:hypothetical protein
MKIEKFSKDVSTIKYKFWRFGWTFDRIHQYADSFTLIDSHGLWRGIVYKLLWLEEQGK